jgi:crotonobetainyl-CoA:carnitine CoA-transferase CaiB-like acyl-CoA transferase
VTFEGLHILELGAGAAGPVATRYFAEHGARVIRVESAQAPDFLRAIFMTKDSPFGLDGSPMYVLLNPNKECVSLNLRTEEGVSLVKRLIEWADVVCENFAPGVMAKWGLDADSLRRSKPELIVASGCLFGQTGPQRSYPGFGGQGSAIAGFNHLTGWPDREPHGPYATITDSLSPRYVAVAVAAALYHRRRTGEGSSIDLSQIESGVYSLSELIVRQSALGHSVTRAGNHSEHMAPHAVYPCAGDDRWIAIAVEDDSQWRALVHEMGDPDGLAELSEHERLADPDVLDVRVAEWTRDQDAALLAERLQAAGVPAGPVQSFQDLLDDPQLAHRGHWVPLRHSNLGELPFGRSGFRLSEDDGALRTPGPNLGEHNREVLGGVLGLSEDEVARLIDDEVAS